MCGIVGNPVPTDPGGYRHGSCYRLDPHSKTGVLLPVSSQDDIVYMPPQHACPAIEIQSCDVQNSSLHPFSSHYPGDRSDTVSQFRSLDWFVEQISRQMLNQLQILIGSLVECFQAMTVLATMFKRSKTDRIKLVIEFMTGTAG